MGEYPVAPRGEGVPILVSDPGSADLEAELGLGHLKPGVLIHHEQDLLVGVEPTGCIVPRGNAVLLESDPDALDGAHERRTPSRMVSARSTPASLVPMNWLRASDPPPNLAPVKEQSSNTQCIQWALRKSAPSN